MTHRDSVAAAAASRNPHPRATAATSRTRAGWVTAIAPNTAASTHPTSSVAPFLPTAACSHQSRCQPSAGSTTSWATKPSTPPGLDMLVTRELCAARMTGTWSSRPAARPAVTACSRTRRSAAIRRMSSGASASASGVDAPARNAISAARAMPPRPRGRHRPAQNSANSRYQGVLTPLSAISSGATGSSRTAAASSPRSQTERMCPALAWKTNSATADAITAPAMANAAAASAQRQK